MPSTQLTLVGHVVDATQPWVRGCCTIDIHPDTTRKLTLEVHEARSHVRVIPDIFNSRSVSCRNPTTSWSKWMMAFCMSVTKHYPKLKNTSQTAILNLDQKLNQFTPVYRVQESAHKNLINTILQLFTNHMCFHLGLCTKVQSRPNLKIG